MLHGSRYAAPLQSIDIGHEVWFEDARPELPIPLEARLLELTMRTQLGLIN